MKKEKMTLEKLGELIEKLAVFTMNGFEKIESEISSVKGDVSSLKSDVSLLKGDVSSLKDDVSFIKQRVYSIEEEQKETNRRLASIDKKQLGTVLSLDETVHRNEFNGIVRRVEILEKQ
ncbi:MAG: hypothetical protein NTZ13_00310 [Candidatus Parcubacteria bacterium]|nr:hypothetical protein [Candidatus Parcubacteria bacterium]